MTKFDDIISKIEIMSVVELAELVRALEEKFGVSAAMPVGAAGAAIGEATGEEKTSWNVLLKEGGSQKIQVIKVLKEALGVGLQESKSLVDAAPKVIKERLKKEDAEELKKKLEAAGAVVELQ
jgi:large subunit ribosomal protein L7/L12